MREVSRYGIQGQLGQVLSIQENPLFDTYVGLDVDLIRLKLDLVRLHSRSLSQMGYTYISLAQKTQESGL